MTRQKPDHQFDTDPWHVLRMHTDARIGLGRAGDGLPTDRLLEFQMAHARARDSVHMPYDIAAMTATLGKLALPVPILAVQSAAADRAAYLQRPDLGRRLDDPSRQQLTDHHGSHDVAFILADGLSARATHEHAADTLSAMLERIDPALSLAPIVLASQARVGLGDEIGQLLGAQLTVMLIGERPGLSSADSLGAYLTWGPRPGRSNAERNCVSNIRPAGLLPTAAAHKILYLIDQARKMGLSGVQLKDHSARPHLASPADNPALPDNRTDQ